MNLYDILKHLHISYIEIEHSPVFTVEQAQFIKKKLVGIGCKSLFLTNKKGNYYLVLLDESKKANLKEIATIASTSHLSFASSEELKKVLNLEPGSVTPFGIIYDKHNLVTLILDCELQNQFLLVPSNTNRKTISISYQDLIKFIEYENHSYLVTNRKESREE